MKHSNTFPANYLNLSDDCLRRFMRQATGSVDISLVALMANDPYEKWLGQIATWLSVPIVNLMYTDDPTEISYRYDLNHAVNIAKILLAISEDPLHSITLHSSSTLALGLLETSEDPFHSVTLNSSPEDCISISEVKAKLSAPKLRHIMASGCVIAIRALMERQSFLHALAQSLRFNDPIALEEWQALWDMHEALVVEDAEVEAAMQRHFPSLADALKPLCSK
jgi:hypothetical protein